MNWLLLRGLGRHSGFWNEFPELLEEELKVKTLCLDLPGLNCEETNFRSVDDMVDEMRERWINQKGSEAWSIMAISLGGMIALNWVARYPEDFKNIVTINSSDKEESLPHRRLTPAAFKYLIKIAMDKSVREKERKVIEITSNLTEITDELLDYHETIGKKSGMTIPLVLRQLWAAFKFKAPERFNTPYTVLTSKGDKFVDYRCSVALAKKYDAHLKIHETAGHDIPLDDPFWVINQIADL